MSQHTSRNHNTHRVTFSRRATLEWMGDVPHGSGSTAAGSGAFSVAVTFPRLSGDPAGTTTPEELLAASHATCFGIGLRAVLAKRGALAQRVRVTSTVTAEKGEGRIRITGAHLEGVVEGLTGLQTYALAEVAHEAEEACTISAVLRVTVPVTVEVHSA